MSTDLDITSPCQHAFGDEVVDARRVTAVICNSSSELQDFGDSQALRGEQVHDGLSNFVSFVWLLKQARLLFFFLKFSLFRLPVFCAVNCSRILSATETFQLSKRPAL